MKNIITGEKVTWVDIQDPTKEDIKYLKDNFNFHPLVLEELSNFGYRPKVEAYEDYLFMTFYYPVHMKEKRETRPREIDIIITRDAIITSHYKSILPLKSLFDKCNLYPEIEKRYMGGSAEYILFLLLNGLWKNCLIKLDRINLKLEMVEKEMFEGKEKEMVREISFVKTDLINFWRIVEPQKETLEELSKEGIIYFGEAFRPYLSDVIATYKKSWNSLQTFKETILAMEDTNQSLLSTKTNEVIQVLTVFSAVMLPLTLIASMWGMNLNLPFDGSPFGFWIILAIMVTLMIFLISYFNKKKWI